jgi:hypothetical protein
LQQVIAVPGACMIGIVHCNGHAISRIHCVYALKVKALGFVLITLPAKSRYFIDFSPPGSNDTRPWSTGIKRHFNFGVFKKERILF